MGCTSEKYPWPSSVNVANFVTVRLDLRKGEERSMNFDMWKKQMLCFLESQDVVGFINGERVEPKNDEQKLWRRSDRLVKGWILGSIRADVLQWVCHLETARDVWLELDNIFLPWQFPGLEMGTSNFDQLTMDYTNEKYLRLSSVNVANFVTVRPELRDEKRSCSFKIWKEQMMCFLESQDVACFINNGIIFRHAELKKPQTDKQKLWRRSDRLVKGWILGSIGADVLPMVCELETAWEVWLHLEKIFNGDNTSVSEIQPREELDYTNEKYSSLSSVNVANFVTVRPQLNEKERSSNFKLWKKQMLCLLKSQDLVGFIKGETKEPQSDEQKLWEITDRLVRLWILGSIGTDVLQYVCELETSQEVWLELDYIFNFVFSAERGFEMKPSMLWPSSVNVAKFVTVRPQLNEEEERSTNFNIWREQMLCLLKSQEVVGFVEGEMVGPQSDESKLWGITDRLVKGWILRSIGTDVLQFVCQLETSREVWFELHYIFNFVFSSERVFEITSSNLWPSSVNVAKFVTERPLRNFKVWKEQMLCLLKSQDVVGFIEESELVEPQSNEQLWRITDRLIKGWILGSVGADVLQYVCVLETARDVWLELEKIFNNPNSENGISEIVEVIIEMYPALATSVDKNGRTIMHMAVSGRFENVFNLNYNKIDCTNKFYNYDNKYDSLLDLCARLPNPERLNIVTGAALQMQRELQWFNEVEKFVLPIHKLLKKEGKTAKMLFAEQHRKLKEEGEKWLKDTAHACSIATALIATVVFAATFTMPGGVSSETGIPIFFKELALVLFATTNVASFFTSITSLLLFLSILTSRIAEQDFLYSLPTRLSHGLLTLFVSITYMVVAFGAAFYLLFGTKLIWFIIPVATYGWFPVASFVRLQFPLLVDILYSTYGPGIFRKHTRERNLLLFFS